MSEPPARASRSPSSWSGSRAHNLAMAELWRCRHPRRARSTSSRPGRTCCSPSRSRWRCSAARVGCPLRLWADRLALAYAAFVAALRWLLPQSWLDGAATHRGQLFAAAARPDPGRRLLPRPPASSLHAGDLAPALARRSSGSPSALTVWGLVDVYLVPLQWWRDSGVPGWFERPARARLPRALAACRRTGSTTRATRTIRSGGSSRRFLSTPSGRFSTNASMLVLRVEARLTRCSWVRLARAARRRAGRPRSSTRPARAERHRPRAAAAG